MPRKKKIDSHAMYSSSNQGDIVTEKVMETWELISNSDEPEDVIMTEILSAQMELLQNRIPKVGEKSAIELLGKLGIWLSENEIEPADIRSKLDY